MNVELTDLRNNGSIHVESVDVSIISPRAFCLSIACSQNVHVACEAIITSLGMMFIRLGRITDLAMGPQETTIRLEGDFDHTFDISRVEVGDGHVTLLVQKVSYGSFRTLWEAGSK